MSQRIATAQIEPCSAPSVADAVSSRPTPSAVRGGQPETERRSPGSSLLAATNRTIWPTRTTP